MEHELKIDEIHFKQIVSGVKTFEIRFNDRKYKEGDRLLLNVNPACMDMHIHAVISIVHEGLGMNEGFVVLGLQNVTAPKNKNHF